MSKPESNAKQFADQALAGEWQADPLPQGIGDPSPVPFWLYSHNAGKGSRLIVQMLEDTYVNGLPAELLSQLSDPLLAHTFALQLFDGTPERERLPLHQLLSATLFNYAKNTSTWGVLPDARSTDGIHFIVFDWVSAEGKQMFGHKTVIGKMPLSPSEIAVLGQTLILDTP